MRLFALILLPIVFAEICPMDKHAVCNSGNLACTCSVTQDDENPVPEISCNSLIARDLETGSFPVVSVEFQLDSSSEGLEEFPEDAFKEKISSSLRVEEDNIVILRVSCMGTDDSLTVQFVIQKKETNSSALPFEIDDLINAESIATRMKAMGHLSQIANLDVDTIEYTDDLIDLEFEPSNLELIFKAILLAAVFGFFFFLGIWKLTQKKEDYSSDLQKA